MRKSSSDTFETSTEKTNTSTRTTTKANVAAVPKVGRETSTTTKVKRMVVVMVKTKEKQDKGSPRQDTSPTPKIEVKIKEDSSVTLRMKNKILTDKKNATPINAGGGNKHKKAANNILEVDPIDMLRNLRYQKPPIYEKTFTSAHLVTLPEEVLTTGQMFVVKKFDLGRMPQEMKFTRKDMELHLRTIQRTIHPAIIRLLHIVASSDHLIVLMPHYPMGSIEDYMHNVLKAKPVASRQASCWFAQALGPVKYLHDKGIAHRNLKLGSFLLKKELRPSVVLSGFGMNCQQYRQDYDIMRSTVVGESPYRAPEVQSMCARIWPYDARAADMYSLGVCLYRMLSMAYPFDQNLFETNQVAYIYRQRQLNYTFPSNSTANDKQKDLIKRLLDPTPGLRYTVQYALTHVALDPEG